MSDLPPTLDNLEEENFKLGSALQKGYITAGIGVGIYLLLYLAGPKVMVHWAVGLVSIVVTVVMLILLGRSERSVNYGGYMSYKNAYLMLMTITTAYVIITTLIQYVILALGDPDFLTQMGDLSIEQAKKMSESLGREMSEQELEKLENDVRKATELSLSNYLYSISVTLAGYAVFNSLVALGIRKNKPVF